SRVIARNRRFTRLRTTALPTALDTTKPTRAGSPARSERRQAWTTTLGRPARNPRRITYWKSALRRSRFAVLSTAGRWTSRRQADSSTRPLRRRDDRIARPARVRIRTRNPWVRLRRRLLGWKVRLLTGTPVFSWPPRCVDSPSAGLDGLDQRPSGRNEAGAADSSDLQTVVKAATTVKPRRRHGGQRGIRCPRDTPVEAGLWPATGCARPRPASNVGPRHPL